MKTYSSDLSILFCETIYLRKYMEGVGYSEQRVEQR